MREQDKTINVTAWPPLINFDRWLSFYFEISEKNFSIKSFQLFEVFNDLFQRKKYSTFVKYRGLRKISDWSIKSTNRKQGWISLVFYYILKRMID